jgi:hypothetical protein
MRRGRPVTRGCMGHGLRGEFGGRAPRDPSPEGDRPQHPLHQTKTTQRDIVSTESEIYLMRRVTLH